MYSAVPEPGIPCLELFGKKFDVPLLLAPIGVNSILHKERELIPARVCAELGVLYVLSNVSSQPMEKVAEVMGNAERWFQLYPPNEPRLMESFLDRAEKAGFSAIS
jgi:isopentenyl diphosphate isomerase/L-lactate dehydrogenase-like FMN-dependent dehydrogenase